MDEVKIIDLEDLEIVDLEDNWYGGKYKNYEFEAEVFNEPFDEGLPFPRKPGKISELEIFEDTELVMSYHHVGFLKTPDLMRAGDCYKDHLSFRKYEIKK